MRGCQGVCMWLCRCARVMECVCVLGVVGMFVCVFVDVREWLCRCVRMFVCVCAREWLCRLCLCGV